MSKQISRQRELTSVSLFPTHPGSRAVFLAEARTKKEVRQIRELFDMVGQLAQVVPISHGAVMSYAVQLQGDTTLFGKIEWLLKTQFSFSLVERNFSDVTFQLIRSLCEESDTQIVELPDCGICGQVDPFPTRATLEMASSRQPMHVSYCPRCSARHAEEDPAAFIQGLLTRDRRGFKVGRAVPVRVVPEIVEERPLWEAAPLAIAV